MELTWGRNRYIGQPGNDLELKKIDLLFYPLCHRLSLNIFLICNKDSETSVSGIFMNHLGKDRRVEEKNRCKIKKSLLESRRDIPYIRGWNKGPLLSPSPHNSRPRFMKHPSKNNNKEWIIVGVKRLLRCRLSILGVERTREFTVVVVSYTNRLTARTQIGDSASRR